MGGLPRPFPEYEPQKFEGMAVAAEEMVDCEEDGVDVSINLKEKGVGLAVVVEEATVDAAEAEARILGRK